MTIPTSAPVIFCGPFPSHKHDDCFMQIAAFSNFRPAQPAGSMPVIWGTKSGFWPDIPVVDMISLSGLLFGPKVPSIMRLRRWGGTMNRLLIVACSRRKKPAKEQMPAIERYDGPAFRVLRKFLREQEGPVPTILILSGKYGLIEADASIRNYEFRMTPATAEQLRPTVLRRLRKVLRAGPIRSVGVCLGRDYRQAVKGLEDQLPKGATVEVLGGGLGHRLTRLREWLNRPGAKSDDVGGGM